MATHIRYEVPGVPPIKWYDLIAETYSTATSSLIVFLDGEGFQTWLIGSFAVNGMGVVTSGTITAMQRTSQDGGTLIEQIVGLSQAVIPFLLTPLPDDKFALVLAGNDTFIGHSGSDTFRGFAGNDVFAGGLDDDLYLVEDGGDVIYEVPDGGYDGALVAPNIYTVPGNLELVAFMGTGNFECVGNDQNNRIEGASGFDTLSGLGGNDFLDGAGGNDIMIGGEDDDTYHVTDAGDLTIENIDQGIDTVYAHLAMYTLQQNVENLTINHANGATGTGNALDNVMTGGAGDDTLSGLAGNDVFGIGLGNDEYHGGIGDDRYFVDSAGDIAIEANGEGNDEVRTFLGSGTLSDNVEILTYIAFATFAGTGNAGDNDITGAGKSDILKGLGGDDRLFGLGGADTLDGGTGADVLRGGSDGDTYVVDDAADVADEQPAGSSGIDTVRAGRTFSLGDTAHAKGSIENLTLVGTGAFNATGNALANALIGNAGANRLTGLAGKDTLTGNGGNDFFVYKAAANSRGVNADTIKDFDDMGNDRIHLSAVFDGTLIYRGLGAFTGIGQVHIKDIAGPNVLVEVNLSGGLAPEMTIRLLDTTAASMTKSDFVL